MTHKHHHGQEDTSVTRLVITMVLNLVITVAEVIGGLISGSLSLLSDAMHNFSDAFAIVLSYVAIRLSKLPSSERYTFGLKRAETFAAIINTTVLVVISFFLIIEAVQRIMTPEHVNGLIMAGIAGIGLIANVVGTILLKKGADKNINLKSTYLHLLSDAVTSIGVVIGGIVIYFWKITWLDGVLTVVISLYILKEAASIIKDGVKILMMGAPTNISIEEIQEKIEALPEVESFHHSHIWMLTENYIHLEAHLELIDMPVSQATEIIAKVESMLKQDYSISHVTLQIEAAKCKCIDLVNDE